MHMNCCRALFLTYATLFSLCLASAAKAEFEAPDGCVRGNGTYSGDLSGTADYIMGRAYPDSSSPSHSIFIEGQMIRGKGSSAEPGWYGSLQGITISVSDPGEDGGFTGSKTSDFGHVIELKGTYSNCRVTGTWTLTYNKVYANLSPRTGTFDIQGNGESTAVKSGGGARCGAMNAANILILMAMAVGFLLRSQLRRAL